MTNQASASGVYIHIAVIKIGFGHWWTEQRETIMFINIYLLELFDESSQCGDAHKLKCSFALANLSFTPLWPLIYPLQIYFLLQTNKIVSNIVDVCHILFHIQFFKINDEHARSLWSF